MFPNCTTPPLKKYINLKGLPNKKFSCMRFLTPHARFLCSEIDHISANSIRIQKGFRPWIRGPGGIVWWKKNEGPATVCGSFALSVTTFRYNLSAPCRKSGVISRAWLWRLRYPLTKLPLMIRMIMWAINQKYRHTLFASATDISQFRLLFGFSRTLFHLNCLTTQLSYEGGAAVEGAK
jgi:hypothetical protein